MALIATRGLRQAALLLAAVLAALGPAVARAAPSFERIETPRGPRGEVESATNTGTGETVSFVPAFGAAVLQTQTNGLGQSITHTVDEQGRTTATTDANGLRERVVLDDFGRPTAEYVRNDVGVEWLVRDHTRDRTTTPFTTRTREYDRAGAVVATSWAVEDGFGRVVQTWRQRKDGTFQYENSRIDLAGNVLETGHPVAAGASYTPASLAVAATRAESWFDAFGRAREHTPDAAAGLATATVVHDEPRVELREDAEGYQTQLTYDAHHRIIAVHQGTSDGLELTAEYAYDAKHRLVRFTDAGGTVHAYQYDGAGRLRETQLASPAAPSLRPWRSYEYQGEWRIRQSDPAGGYAEWTLDALGRPEALAVSDPLPGAPLGEMAYTWEWAPVDGPSGTTAFLYDDLGRTEVAARSLPGRPTVSVNRQYDLAGREVSRTLPSGRTIESDYDFGVLAQHRAVLGGATEYTIAYDYDQWGGPAVAHASVGIDFIVDRSTPAYVDRLAVNKAGVLESVDLSFADNGLLSSSTRLGQPARTYVYDDLRQLTEVRKLGATEESFTFDEAGNLESLVTAGGTTWTYAAATENRIPSRTAGLLTEQYRYDAAGNMTGWDTAVLTRELRYDGLGRLRMVSVGGILTEAFDYDDGSTLLRHSVGNPITASPNQTLSFQDWERDTATGVATERHTPFSAARGALREWHFRELNGHVAATFNDAGASLSSRRFGAYGDTQASTGAVWAREAFHGGGQRGAGEFFHLGWRHLAQNDGRWLQPEPLLYKGIPQELLANPVALRTYRYAGNNPSSLTDPSGYAVETPWDVFTVALGVTSFSYNMVTGNTVAAQYDAVGIAYDVTATSVPGAPGGASVLLASVRLGGRALCDDIVRAGMKAIRSQDGVLDDASRGTTSIAERVAKAMEGTPLKPTQGNVSGPKVERMVEAIEGGAEMPPIKVDGGYIVDGHHRYVAGQVAGKPVATTPGGSVPAGVKEAAPSWSEVNVLPEDY